ncbi:MAG: DUF456 family protein [Sinobacteraceae bacterium]|nr:DUF456 family protein [Nevskiaceae bacterium]MCP5466892.1 DUF456 family protein [Nevskiaceae bacterium]MCP5470981.1 DUF456 family protein [Nevskiaceae bacterium]
MDPTLLWLFAIALILVGIAGTVLPGVPGVMAVFGGMLLAAWIDDFSRIGWVTLVILGVLTAMAFAADIIGSLLGAKRVGASRLALLGAAVGALAAFPFGFFGLLFGPFLGAVAGELITQQRLDAAARVGLGTWIGLAVGSLAKIALLFAMLGVFLTSYLLG